MSDKEKAREIASKWWQDLITKEHCDSTEEAIERAVLEMAQWKEDDILNKICNWLMNNSHKYVNSYGSAAYENYQLVDDLRIAIKE